MTHDEMLDRVQKYYDVDGIYEMYKALRSVVKLHKPVIHALPDETCLACQDLYPCSTIQAIEKELK
jgi:hypothetical protein